MLTATATRPRQIITLGLSYVAKAGEKVFHYLFTIALLVGSIAYFAWASDLGFDVVAQANRKDFGATRQIFWVKYVYWVVAFPVVNLVLGLISGVSWATIIYNIFLAWTWVISYLVSAYTVTNYKWGFYAFGTVAYLIMAVNVFFGGRAGAKRTGTSSHFQLLACWVELLWLLYPIAFGLTDGGNRIGGDATAIFFGILDILMVPPVAFAVLVLARGWDYGKLNLYFTQYGRVAAAPGEFPEKTPAAPAAPLQSGEAAA